jgi:hypothetical protein
VVVTHRKSITKAPVDAAGAILSICRHNYQGIRHLPKVNEKKNAIRTEDGNSEPD